ncbi:hypothetical protein GDO78_005731 [Eleutherodactylus coqui]|uniref:Uncharacterized protein n=1 Tax=Eleutherodactylus coqui TaxID=57060 RepID=A0A8J6FKW8_ELECQ|nr:hypothetical protein GDO78_005731 [Eleutherodactylus coqui]
MPSVNCKFPMHNRFNKTCEVINSGCQLQLLKVKKHRRFPLLPYTPLYHISGFHDLLLEENYKFASALSKVCYIYIATKSSLLRSLFS